jgi:hypothetical protein
MGSIWHIGIAVPDLDKGKQELGEVHPSNRTGVRFVLTNPSDPSRLDEFSDWYDTYSEAITVPGYLANDVHFENPDASGERNSPRYATIYDIVSPDPATAWPDTEHSAAYPTHLFSDPRAKLVSPALRASYALVGSQLQPGQHGPLTGIHVILSNGSGDTERQHQEAQILQTGLFYSAARFRLIEGSPTPPEWLEVFETDDPDPLHAYPRATHHTPPASRIQPQLSQSFRLAGSLGGAREFWDEVPSVDGAEPRDQVVAVPDRVAVHRSAGE